MTTPSPRERPTPSKTTPAKKAQPAKKAPATTIVKAEPAAPIAPPQPPMADVVAIPAEPVSWNISQRFRFDGGAGSFLGVGILAFLVTFFTLGLAFPYALVLQQRWRCRHTYIDGYRLVFTGTGIGLFGNWIKWFLLTLITLGIYGFWVAPRINKWVVEHTDFDRATYPPLLGAAA